ncbi:MAG: hypothetical protein HW413_2272 [Thermoleophilia bacterium]|nr:hypothetical protein [Thermoleophilia bacterium]
MKGSAVRVRASALSKDLQNVRLPLCRRSSKGLGGNTRGNTTCRFGPLTGPGGRWKLRCYREGWGVSSEARARPQYAVCWARFRVAAVTSQGQGHGCERVPP